MFPAWVWTRMPEARIISASFDHILALTFARKSRDIVLSDKYQVTFLFKQDPKTKKWRPSQDKDATPIQLKDDQNSKSFYENTARGDRKTVGAGGNITGSHSHFIIVDDPINPKKALEDKSRKKINEWMTQTLPSRKVNKEISPTILIMQRLHQDDPTGHMLSKQKENVKHICLPAEKSDLVKPARLKLKYVNGLLDPVRLSPTVLKEARDDLLEYGYAGQFMQSPVPAGGGSFKVDRLSFDTPPIAWRRKVRYWDKAGTAGGGAFTAGVLMGEDMKGRFWVLDVVRGQWDSGRREDTIKLTAILDKKNVYVGVEQEPGSGGKESAEATVRRLAGYKVKIDRVTGSKELRADQFSSQVNSGNVSIKKDAAWVPEFLEEMRFFPYGRYKDQIDAASGAFARLVQLRRIVGAVPDNENE
jgi:predicted phage terminase large subunit-like protein